jgi:hypothetical protein
MATVGQMTLDELKALIDQRIRERLSALFGEFEISEEDFFAEKPDTRSLEEVFASIDEHMWTPPPGAKSSLELLREDRER